VSEPKELVAMHNLVERKDLGQVLARLLIEAAMQEARQIDLAMAVAVVDGAGNLVALERMDGAQLVAVPLAIDKAWTAVACSAPTEEWAGSTIPGGEDWGMSTALAGRIVVLPGGLPVMDGEAVIGGVGVSGGYGHEDKRCAMAAVGALAAA
jgi:uncharacterized protein GlcG (DUF336 family)